jgi:hypothetical protein
MNTPIILRPRWSTASFGASADTSPKELAALGAHLTLCQGHHARLQTMQRMAHTVHGFIAARFVTTLVVLTLLMVAMSLVL